MKSIVVGVLVMMGLVIAAFAVQPEDGEQSIKEATEEVANDESKSDAVGDEEKFVYFQMTTSMGEIFIELNNELAPISTANFLEYAKEGYYDGTIFHRVIPNFMIQGGGFTADMKKKKTRDGIENEWTNGLSHVRGTLAMARVGGDINSGTSQFFINVKDNIFLGDPQPDGAAYAVFGRVVQGMDVVDKIRLLTTGYKGGMRDVPIETVTIEKVVVLEADTVEELGLVESDG